MPRTIYPHPVYCRICGHRKARQDRPGGTCDPCRRAPESYRGRGGHPPPEERDFFGGHDLPDEPTSAPVGSREREAVYEERRRARRSLHHPADGRASDAEDRERELAARAAIDAAKRGDDEGEW